MRSNKSTSQFVNRISGKLNSIVRKSRMRRKLASAGLSAAHLIPTFTTTDELAVLMELASQVPPGSNVVEIGSYLGASTCYIASGLVGKGCMLTCVDTWQNETMPDGQRDTLQEFERNVQPVAHMISVVRKRTDLLHPGDLPEKATLAFLDGDHSYAAAKSDFALLAARVSHNGVIALHDTLYYQGVSRVLGDALATGQWRLEGCCNNLSWIRRAPFNNPDPEVA